jgi:hypothetical protein
MAQPTGILTLALFAAASVGLADEKTTPGMSTPPPWKLQAGYRVLDPARVPIVIDQPGRYTIDRDWNVDLDAPGALIHIVSNNVTFDLRGFAIAFGNEGTGVAIDGNSVVVRNGALIGDIDVTSLRSVGNGTMIDNMRINGYLAVDIQGEGARVRNSAMSGRFGTVLIGASVVAENNVLRCGSGAYCLEVGSDARVSGNDIGTAGNGAVQIRGNGSILQGNIVDFRDAIAPVALSVEGNRNVLRENTVLVSGLEAFEVVFVVDGTANVLDGNITAPSTSDRGGIGIAFSQDGNYHGDNRFGGVVEAIKPNGTVQTDWGGTVTF